MTLSIEWEGTRQQTQTQHGKYAFDFGYQLDSSGPRAPEPRADDQNRKEKAVALQVVQSGKREPDRERCHDVPRGNHDGGKPSQDAQDRAEKGIRKNILSCGCGPKVRAK